MFHHYQIERLLGKGGMGEVYLARDTLLDRMVAIKFLPEAMQEDSQARKRFLREAKSAASLDHPFVCQVYETGEAEQKAYIVMEYVAGETLKDRLDRGPMRLEQALDTACEIVEALAEAHEKGIVHRDLKPANIMLTPQGHPKIMDFGLAKKTAALKDPDSGETITVSEALTREGMLVGTINYMSPEQARGEAVDARSDIFSFGMVLYEMLSGKNPFQRESQVDTLSAILRDASPPLHLEESATPPAILSILNKAMAKDVAARYQKMSELLADLKMLQVKTKTRVPFFRRWPVLAASVLLIAILVFAALTLKQPASIVTKQTETKSISLIIADVQNQTGDPGLDGVLEQLLGISLGGAEGVILFERKQAIGLINRLEPNANGRISEKNARLLCQREGINLIVRASIEKDKNGFLVKSGVIDPISGKTLTAADQTIRERTDIFKTADYLSAKLRVGLGVIPSDSAQAMIKETFTTSSLEAMKAYGEAQNLDALGKEKEAVDAYLRAIDNDPNFGRAYAGLAASYYGRGEWQLAEKYYKDALDRIEQMTDREKHRTRGGYYLFKQNYKRAIEEYSALVQEYPKDLAGHTNLALAYFMGYRMKEAFQEGLFAVELDPDNLDYRYNQSWYALASGDPERAKQEARKTLQINANYAKAFVVLALSELAQNRPVEAAKAYQQLEALGSAAASLAASGLADLALYEGRLGDCAEILKKGIAADLANKSNYRAADKTVMLAETYLDLQKKPLAVEAADQAVKTNNREEILFAAAQVYVESDAEDKARGIAGDLNKKVQDIHQAYGKLIGGSLSLKRGDTTSALKLFEEAQTLVDTWLGRFALGRAYLEAAAFAEAYSEFEKCEKRKGEAASIFLNDLPTYRYLDSLYYYLGRAQEGQGSKEAARQSYQKFLEIKSKADPGDPQVADAMKRFGNL
jgi:serine/threonine protein kinase/tetratricopeptide (TPR) repeat protein